MATSFDKERAMHAVMTTPPIPVGTIKSFGAVGPKYKVGQPLRQLDDGDWMVEVELVETGETAEYRLTNVNHDPAAS
jgi:hypothetical protein